MKQTCHPACKSILLLPFIYGDKTMQRYDGTLLHSVRDDWGLIEVIDHPNKRAMHFGTAIEQSSWLENAPVGPGFEHDRKLLFAAALTASQERGLVLGLGAGTVARQLYEKLPECHLDGVERREAVINVALEYFGLPADERMELYTADAEQFLCEVETPYDFIICDLFDGVGMDETALKLSFIDRCKGELRDNGVFAMNLWHSDPENFEMVRNYIEDCFENQVLYLSESDGNTVAYAFNEKIDVDKIRIKAISTQLGFDTRALVKNLRRIDY